VAGDLSNEDDGEELPPLEEKEQIEKALEQSLPVKGDQNSSDEEGGRVTFYTNLEELD